MSAQWMKSNGMRDNSTARELLKREKFAPELGRPSKAEFRHGRVAAVQQEILSKARAVRNAMLPTHHFDPRDLRSDGAFAHETGGLRLEELPKECKTLVNRPESGKEANQLLTRSEDRFAGRWTPGYVKQLAGAAVQHIKLQSARFTQWMLG